MLGVNNYGFRCMFKTVFLVATKFLGGTATESPPPVATGLGKGVCCYRSSFYSVCIG